MASRERPRDRAIRHGRALTAALGRDIHAARLGAGLSLRAAAEAVGLSYSTFWRVERNEIESVSVETLDLACAAVGLVPSLRAFPAADPARDAAHISLLARLRRRLPDGAPWEVEVPLPIPGDLRALDARSKLAGQLVGFEAETRLTDAQGLERKVMLKKRDARLDRIIVVVSDTRLNREFLLIHREALRPAFPLDTRAITAALSRGAIPELDGLAVL